MDINQLKEMLKHYDKSTIDKIASEMKGKVDPSPEGAKRALSDPSKVREIMSMLTPEDQKKIATVLSNPEKLNAVLKSKEAEQMLKKFKK